jgi:hypothetical protein
VDYFASLAVTGKTTLLVVDSPTGFRRRSGASQISFIIFIDNIFTTLLERLFTNGSDVTGAKSANDCVCRACHAD